MVTAPCNNGHLRHHVSLVSNPARDGRRTTLTDRACARVRFTQAADMEDAVARAIDKLGGQEVPFIDHSDISTHGH